MRLSNKTHAQLQINRAGVVDLSVMRDVRPPGRATNQHPGGIDPASLMRYCVTMFEKEQKIAEQFDPSERAVVFPGGCLDLLRNCPDGTFGLVVTSPPYNIGKEYEKRLKLDSYLAQQAEVIRECVRCLSPHGSVCWQVGNYVDDGAIIPLDTILYPIFTSLGLRMRNRIIWHFEHGLHCSNRFSGRYETIVWFTKSDEYVFDLDSVRVPQKYPGKKYFKGPNAGKYSCNPLGKNSGEGRMRPCRIP